MTRKALDFIEGTDHLPVVLRDFHDQKDVFKSMHDWIGHEVPTMLGKCSDSLLCRVPEPTRTELRHAMEVTWIDGHCYVVDYFLRFMAAHGWTLQRSRADVEFADLASTIKARRERETEALRQGLGLTRAPAPEAPHAG